MLQLDCEPSLWSWEDHAPLLLQHIHSVPPRYLTGTYCVSGTALSTARVQETSVEPHLHSYGAYIKELTKRTYINF